MMLHVKFTQYFIEDNCSDHLLCYLSVVVSVERLSGVRPPPASENTNVGSTKRGVAERVQDRVDGWIDVAEVVGKLPQNQGDVFVRRLLAQHTVQDDEHAVRGPCDDEGKQDGAQRFCGFAILLLLARLLRLRGLFGGAGNVEGGHLRRQAVVLDADQLLGDESRVQWKLRDVVHRLTHRSPTVAGRWRGSCRSEGQNF